MLLTRLKYAILTAASSEEAMMILEHTIPSCVLSGFLFPMMSGSDFIKKLKSLERTRNVPVIVLTGERDAAARKTCIDLGCASFLTKPVEPPASTGRSRPQRKACRARISGWGRP
jgi:CheY-like chemotaxis protein